jgi:hypothetical protein
LKKGNFDFFHSLTVASTRAAFLGGMGVDALLVASSNFIILFRWFGGRGFRTYRCTTILLIYRLSLTNISMKYTPFGRSVNNNPDCKS